MRFYTRLFFFILMAAALIWAWEKVRHLNPFRSENQTEHNIVLKEIVALGKMELVKYHFRDIVEHEVVKPLLPNAKALLIVTGEVIGCIDLTKVKTEDFHVQSDTLIVTLPQPEICVATIDHSKSKVYNTEFALFEEGQLVDDAYKQAEAQLQKSAQEMNILPETKTNAEKMLKPFLEKVAGKKVKLVYKN